MSLATRCTACGTVFRVVEDQLKVSEGWVRCGRCQQVFNAVEGLFDLDREAPPPWTPPATAATPPANSPAAPPTKAPPITPVSAPAPASQAESDVGYLDYAHDPAGDSAPIDLLLDLPAAAPPVESTPGSLFDALIEHHPQAGAGVSTGDVDIDLDAALDEAEASRFDADADLGAEVDIDVEIASLAASVSTSAVDIVLDDAAPDGVAARAGSSAPFLSREATPLPAHVRDAIDNNNDEEGSAPTFLTQAERIERWRRSPLRLSYAIAALLLCVALLLQVALHFRDSLAAGWPQARSTLAGLCQLAGCKLEAPQRIDSVTVESSGLTRSADGSGYKLSVVLNNRAAYAIAIPSIDLSLTDSAGQVMARRVLHPADFKPAVNALKANGVTTLELVMSSNTKPMAGYAVEVFYP